MPGIPEWKLERYVLGELPEEEIRDIDERRKSDPAVNEAVSRIERSNREILSTYPAERMRQEIYRKARDRGEVSPGTEPSRSSRREKRRRSMFLLPRLTLPHLTIPRIALPAAAALALVFILLFSQQTQFPGGAPSGESPHDQPGIRLKGMEPGIYAFRKSGEEPEPLSAGAMVSEGDLLQLGFVAPGADNAVLFSVDGRGVVTLHYPQALSGSADFSERGMVLLESSYRLDDAPDFERFYLLTSGSELDAGTILEEVRSRIRSEGSFESSVEELNSSELLGEHTGGDAHWHVFTLRK